MQLVLYFNNLFISIIKVEKLEILFSIMQTNRLGLMILIELSKEKFSFY